MLRPGDQFGDFFVERPLGAGAMGAVFLVRRGDASFALKLPTIHGLEARLRFEREARALAAVDKHPNILRVFSYGSSPQPYLILELLEGETLQARLLRDGPIPLDQALAWLSQLASALSWCHERGIVHRDLKPENIFICGNSLKLTDFGLALDEREQRLSVTGQVSGTPLVMAPEQWQGQPEAVGEKADIWAWGIVACWIINGEPPFRATNLFELQAQILRAARPELSRAQAAPALRELLLSALQVEPSARPTADELLARLQSLDGAPTPATTLAQKSLPRVLLALAAIVALILGASLGLSHRPARRESASPAMTRDSLEALRAQGLFAALADAELCGLDSTQVAGIRQALEKISEPGLRADEQRSLDWLLSKDEGELPKSSPSAPRGRIREIAEQVEALRARRLERDKGDEWAQAATAWQAQDWLRAQACLELIARRHESADPEGLLGFSLRLRAKALQTGFELLLARPQFDSTEARELAELCATGAGERWLVDLDRTFEKLKNGERRVRALKLLSAGFTFHPSPRALPPQALLALYRDARRGEADLNAIRYSAWLEERGIRVPESEALSGVQRRTIIIEAINSYKLESVPNRGLEHAQAIWETVIAGARRGWFDAGIAHILDMTYADYCLGAARAPIDELDQAIRKVLQASTIHRQALSSRELPELLRELPRILTLTREALDCSALPPMLRAHASFTRFRTLGKLREWSAGLANLSALNRACEDAGISLAELPALIRAEAHGCYAEDFAAEPDLVYEGLADRAVTPDPEARIRLRQQVIEALAWRAERFEKEGYSHLTPISNGEHQDSVEYMSRVQAEIALRELKDCVRARRFLMDAQRIHIKAESRGLEIELLCAEKNYAKARALTKSCPEFPEDARAKWLEWIREHEKRGE